MDIDEFDKYLTAGGKCHMVGIGGVSMSPLAQLLFAMGIEVTGSDMNPGEAVDNLIELGIKVTVGHSVENIQGAKYIIRTAAARDDNIEIKAARDSGIPVFERALAWGYIMRKYKNAVCVSGAHGKTTTTSMITCILLAADSDPTVMIGGTLPLLGSGYRVGSGDTIVLESCEYYNSYHNFFPTIAIVLNIDADHLDFFTDIEDLKNSFRKFASLVPDDGSIICNADDINTMDSLTKLDRELFTFGIDSDADIRGVNISTDGKNPKMDVLYKGEFFCTITLQVPGIHNLKNALAAISAAVLIGIPAHTIQEGLQSFTGAGRRFEYKGNINGADIYDDYAHHPSELRAIIDSASKLNYNRIILAFQPHTYSRTRALFSDFVTELSRPDITFLAQIYAAREAEDPAISSWILADSIKGSRAFPDLNTITEEISKIAKEGDIILTVGAGDIYKVSESLVNF